MTPEIIDMHVHFGAPEDPASGCFWSPAFEKSVAYYAMLLMTRSLFKKIDIKRVKEHLLDAINGSKSVKKIVLLAMDMVYDKTGKPHRDKTNLYVPNKYLAELTKNEERVLWGASVHPYRPDWKEELDFCLENGAVLCKWIPSSQMLNPDNPDFDAFYRKLAEHKLPLLCHCGPEYSIPTSDEAFNEFNNPQYLERPLDAGVTVIIAHCSMPYFWFLDADYQDDFEEFFKLFEQAKPKNWQLYADVSAFCNPLRIEDIKKVIKNIPHDRLVFGSDYPVPLFEITYNKSTNFLRWIWFIIKAALTGNPLDKNYKLVNGMGFNKEIFYKASQLFARIQPS